jgi:glycosyltransferase involved in cell wall biosynthesis
MTNVERPVVFVSSDDWASGLKTSKYHLAIRLARTRPVMYVNSIGLRNATGSSRDVSRMVTKLREWLRGPRQVAPNLSVVTPLVIPFRRWPAVGIVNRWLLRANLRWAMLRLGIKRPELWVFLPEHVGLLGGLGERVSIYYCVDEFALFPGVDEARVRHDEKALLQRADLVFATATELCADRADVRPDIVYAPHGVDYAHFARALDPDLPVAEEIANLRGRRIGFVGLLEAWVDVELLVRIARSRPDWQLVLIGRVVTGNDVLGAQPNIQMLGPRDYSELPSLMKGMDCMIVPFKVTDMTRHVNPLKMREYLAAGKPVVSTALPEVQRYSHLVNVAPSDERFITAIEEEIVSDTPEKARLRRQAMADESWDARFDAVVGHIEHAMAENDRRSRHSNS